MSFDPAHFTDEAAHEADRILDERDEAQGRADRFAEKGGLNDPRNLHLSESEFWSAMDAAWRSSKLSRPQED